MLGRGFGARVWLGNILMAAVCAGCTVGPDWTAPRMFAPPSWAVARGQPAAGVASEPDGGAADDAWWESFRDPELSALVARAAAANFRVRLAAMRFVESRAALQALGAAQFPAAGAGASSMRDAVSPNGVIDILGTSAADAQGAGLGAGAVPAAAAGGVRQGAFDLFQYGFDASWELDLWGHVRRAVESAEASAAAADETRRDILVSVLAEVARDYCALRGAQAALAVTRAAVAAAGMDLALAQREAGAVGALDVAEASAALRGQAAALPGLTARIEALMNALSYLLGEAPGALRGELETPAAARPWAAASAVPPVPPRVAIGVPAALARRRPDIRAAEARLHAATASIGVAIADFYPRITLNGEVGLEALQLHDLGRWASRSYGFGPSVSLPIFAGGRLRATLELRRASQQEAAIDYQETVVRAWHEVDNALTAYDSAQRRADALSEAAVSAQAAYGLARRLYARGHIALSRVLAAQRGALAAAVAATGSAAEVPADLVGVYKALGGGWEIFAPLR